MTPTFEARPAGSDAYVLGEGPVWDPERQRLLWVDIVAGVVFAGVLEPVAGTIMVTDSWSFTDTVGAVAVAADGSLLVAERAVLTHLDPGGGRAEVARVLPKGSRSRLNDGAVDPAGRFVIGSMADGAQPGRERLVRLEADGGLTTIDDDLHLANGMDWGADGQFYSIDSIPGVVRVRDYEPLGERRDLLSFPGEEPDGMCIDADGNLWIAIWGGSRVECRSPTGELLATVTTTAPHTSSVAFAGPALDILVITTATDELEPAELAAAPDSGRLFTAEVGVRGRLTPYWQVVS